MRNLNILITGVGRRVELVQAFRQAALRMDVNLKIFGADTARTAPALAFCDYARIVCGMRETGYISQLLEICTKDRIDVIIPTIDTDLMVLAEHAGAFCDIGTKVLISAPDKIALCRDKSLTTGFLESCGLLAPRTWHDISDFDGEYPCFIKPKDGSSSIGAHKAKDMSELSVYARELGDYVIQSYIEGTEYTVDVFCDLNGRPVYITPRERIAVRSGEVLKTKITMDEIIIQETRRVIEAFHPVGPLTVQLIREAQSGRDYYIEINPRFGGGAPLSMKAGADSADALIRLLLGEKVEYIQPQQDGAIYSRFDQSVCIESGTSERCLRGVIFDLDDTLYSERDYVKSGFHAVAKHLGNESIEDELWCAFNNGQRAIDAVLASHGLTDLKDECLTIYRWHKPQINLYPGVRELLETLRGSGIKIGIITDGRPEGQRAKLDALGLWDLVDDVIITDELGGVQFRKPNDIAFRIMQCRWKLKFENLLYVGDNPTKDFQAPKQLGMQWLMLDNPCSIHAINAVELASCKTSITETIEKIYSICGIGVKVKSRFS